VNKEMHIDILPRLGDAVRRKGPEIGKPNFGFSFTTMLQHTGRIWSKDNVTTMENLASADFYMFPGFKSALNGRRFCDASLRI
jgi:hypothetical protein